MNAEHNSPEKIGQGQVSVNEPNPGLATEFFRKVTGPIQDTGLDKTEDELLEELTVLIAQRKARAGLVAIAR